MENAPEIETYFFLCPDSMLLRQARQDPERLVVQIRRHEDRAAVYVRGYNDLRRKLGRLEWNRGELARLKRELGWFRRLVQTQAAAPRLALPLAPRASG